MQLSGANIKARRLAAELTREHVAVRMKRSCQTVQNWERDAFTPDARQLGELADYLGCSVADFYVAEEVMS